MPAYLIVRVNVTDSTRFADYIKAVPQVIGRFDGKYIVRGGDVLTLEGPEEKRRIIVIEFPTLQQARNFYNSDEYTEVRKLRTGAAEGEIIAIQGYAET